MDTDKVSASDFGAHVSMREYLDAALTDMRRAAEHSEVSVGEHLTSLINHLQEQLDRRIETQHRELADAKQHLATQIEALDIRVQGVFDEQRRGIQVADAEREKAAEALREEQRLATEMAEREREKAAVQLRSNLEVMIREGDTNLRTHIQEQIRSVEAALAAQMRLGDEKDKRLEAVYAASQQAIDKAEEGIEKRLHMLNEFRAQLADQAAHFLPREVHETDLVAVRRELAAFDKRQQILYGERIANESRDAGTNVTIGQITAAVMVVVAVAAIIVGSFT